MPDSPALFQTLSYTLTMVVFCTSLNRWNIVGVRGRKISGASQENCRRHCKEDYLTTTNGLPCESCEKPVWTCHVNVEVSTKPYCRCHALLTLDEILMRLFNICLFKHKGLTKETFEIFKHFAIISKQPAIVCFASNQPYFHSPSHDAGQVKYFCALPRPRAQAPLPAGESTRAAWPVARLRAHTPLPAGARTPRWCSARVAGDCASDLQWFSLWGWGSRDGDLVYLPLSADNRFKEKRKRLGKLGERNWGSSKLGEVLNRTWKKFRFWNHNQKYKIQAWNPLHHK